ncbi:hypothetical protein DRO69_08810, partial [Candidatus Bathyarchaeota archaeon]
MNKRIALVMIFMMLSPTFLVLTVAQASPLTTDLIDDGDFAEWPGPWAYSKSDDLSIGHSTFGNPDNSLWVFASFQASGLQTLVLSQQIGIISGTYDTATMSVDYYASQGAVWDFEWYFEISCGSDVYTSPIYSVEQGLSWRSSVDSNSKLLSFLNDHAGKQATFNFNIRIFPDVTNREIYFDNIRLQVSLTERKYLLEIEISSFYVKRDFDPLLRPGAADPNFKFNIMGFDDDYDPNTDSDDDWFIAPFDAGFVQKLFYGGYDIDIGDDELYQQYPGPIYIPKQELTLPLELKIEVWDNDFAGLHDLMFSCFITIEELPFEGSFENDGFYMEVNVRAVSKIALNRVPAGQEDLWYWYEIDADKVKDEYVTGLQFLHGMTINAWSAEGYHSNDFDQSIENLARTGVNWVAFTVFWYMKTYNDTYIRRTNKTASDSSLKYAIQRAKDLGLNVMLKPMIDVEDGKWRGEIAPSDWAKWFENYRVFINYYADFAQANNVDLFVIGTELTSSQPMVKDWEEVIDDVKARFSGKITYAANWDAFDTTNVKFWDKLDYVGVDAYFPLTGLLEPTVQQLKNAWYYSTAPGCIGRNWVNELHNVFQETGKKIVFTEIGYTSQNGTNMQPYQLNVSNQFDGEEQADCYTAAFEVFRDKAWFAGWFWWAWEIDPEAGKENDPKTHLGYTPQNKKAENVIMNYSPSDFSNVRVAVIDTGINPDIENLRHRIVFWKDLVDDKKNPYDDIGHGTEVASIITGCTAGVALNVELIVIRVPHSGW